MKKLCLLHTTDQFVEMMSEPFTRPFLKENPDIESFDIADSSLIEETKKAGYATPSVARRMFRYMMAAVDAGADAILVTCTSVNTMTKRIRDWIPIPVLSIEEPVAKLAVEKGTRIGILSSVATSAVPVQTTIQQCAVSAGKNITTEISVADGAFEALTNGDRALHDETIRTALKQLVPKVDMVVFAQFSMALVKHPSYPVPVLKFGRISYDAAREAMYHPEKAKTEEMSFQNEGGSQCAR
jgi:Asp/Glu/hydantoin racemase